MTMERDGIHPAPAEFSDAQVATDPILHFFHYAHLPPKLQATSRLFFILASSLVTWDRCHRDRSLITFGWWGSFFMSGTIAGIFRLGISPVGGNAGFFIMEGTEKNG
jgi:hypothetical protein